MNDRNHPDRSLSAEQRALLALRRLRGRMEEMEAARSEPVAVLGLSCRFPGAPTPEAFWELLREGRDAVTEVPPERWDADAFYDPDPDAEGRMYTLRGGFLSEVEAFDAAFFGISPREAESMDPQQRLILEVAWEALENAGVPADRLAGSRTGVFLGITADGYRELSDPADPARVEAQAGTGSALCMAPNRLSYLLGLRGPSLAVDTACSSSLVAVHLACQSLRAGECDLALVGGVNLILHPDGSVVFCRSRMLSPDGRCKTFDADADGYVRGEGCGVLVLQRRSDAVAEGRRMIALLCGSAVNQDGRSSSLTAPNETAQKELIEAALAAARIEPGDVSYVEAHGTGTALGDPIEVEALAASLAASQNRSPNRSMGRSPGTFRPREEPLWIGSVKTNVGHLEAAAGIAGLIKTVLALEHGQIPPHRNFRRPNPHVDWDDIAVRVAAEGRPWPRGTRRRIAGVSSFGFGGTNAHVLVEEAPTDAATEEGAPVEESTPAEESTLAAAVADRVAGPAILPLSARHPEALAALGAAYGELLEAEDAPAWRSLCAAAATRRSHEPYRAAVVAADGDEARTRLSALAVPEAPMAPVPGDPPPVVFLFSGQGSQYLGMGRGLYESQPVFRQALEECDELLRNLAGNLAEGEPFDGRSLPELLFDAEAEVLASTRFAQPAIFCLEVALTRLWRSWGVVPDAVLGHSLGEYTAAWAAGILSLEDAVGLVFERGRRMAELPPGAMLAVEAGEERLVEVVSKMAGEGEGLSLAAVNGPRACVLSGDEAAVATARSLLEGEGVRCKRLAVSHAFHSHQVEPALDALERRAASCSPSPSTVDFACNLSGELLDAGETLDAAYWRAQSRRPVRFADGFRALWERGYRVFLEVGPTPVLLGACGETCGELSSEGAGAAPVLVPSLRRGEDDDRRILEALADLYRQGLEIDWGGVFGRDLEESGSRDVKLPNYPWRKTVCWWRPRRAVEAPEPWEVACAAAREQAGMVPMELDLASFPSRYRLLERTAVGYMTRALRELGVFREAGERRTPGELLERCGVAETYRHLLERWLERLAAEGLLECREGGSSEGGSFEAVTPLPEPDLEETWRELRASEGDFGPLLDYLERCGDRLVDVLMGRLSALDTLFPGGSFETADNLYHRWSVARYFNAIVRAAVGAALRSLPREHAPRLLEIGAGTGGTTASLLPSLPPETAVYEFTDLSELFLARARERFGGTPFLRCGLLNIEQEPAAQGYPAGGYDVVIASNVLHATRDLRRTLDHCRRLLAPGGLLVAYETTENPPWVDVTTGLVEGWQIFEDDLRGDHPLLPPAIWRRALEEQGFAATLALPPESSPSEVLGQHVYLARAPGQVRASRLATGFRRAAELREPEVRAASAPVSPEAVQERLARLREALPEDRERLLVDYVREQIVQVLRLPPDAPAIDRGARLMDLGLDSLMAVDLRNRLSRGLGLGKTLPATLVFDYPTLESVAAYLGREELGLELGRSPEGPPDARAEAVAALSEDEIEGLLLEKLNAL